MGHKATGILAVLALTLGTSACHGAPNHASQRMQIVLSSRDSVFLADWQGRDLQPRLLTDYKGAIVAFRGSTTAVADTIAIIASASNTHKDAAYLIDSRTGTYRKALEQTEVPSFHAIALAPDKLLIAFLSGKGVFVYDLAERTVRHVVHGRPGLALSWMPDGKQLTYDTDEGWIESVTLGTQRIERLVRGGSPAWSPDGARLAYRDENGIFIYEPARRVSREIHRRTWWRRPMFGGLYWSPDGRYLSFNAGWDLLGLTFDRCVVLDLPEGRTFTVGSGGPSLYCGPWLAWK